MQLYVAVQYLSHGSFNTTFRRVYIESFFFQGIFQIEKIRERLTNTA